MAYVYSTVPVIFATIHDWDSSVERSLVCESKALILLAFLKYSIETYKIKVKVHLMYAWPIQTLTQPIKFDCDPTFAG